MIGRNNFIIVALVALGLLAKEAHAKEMSFYGENWYSAGFIGIGVKGSPGRVLSLGLLGQPSLAVKLKYPGKFSSLQ